MGAQEFHHYVNGELDPKRAFNQAVEQAQWDHGHSGYSGSIAEKDEYTIITEAGSLPYEEAMALSDELMDAADPRIDDKWGPAGAIRVKGGNAYGYETVDGWLFFGWASS